MRGFGGIVTAMLKRDLAGTKRFLERCQLFTLAESLGGVESLIEHPAIMTHASIPKTSATGSAFRIRWCGCPSASKIATT
jgi:cystathionine gamma-lyase